MSNFNNTEPDKITTLCERFGWSSSIAITTVEARGICQYCNEDLLATRIGYSSLTTDHLLPTSKYPEYTDDPRNHVLVCSSCNWIKGSWDPVAQLKEDGKASNDSDTDHLFSNHRDALIDKVRERFRQQQFDRATEWRTVKEIVRGAY